MSLGTQFLAVPGHNTVADMPRGISREAIQWQRRTGK
jgi:hypothetical protein